MKLRATTIVPVVLCPTLVWMALFILGGESSRREGGKALEADARTLTVEREASVPTEIPQQEDAGTGPSRSPGIEKTELAEAESVLGVIRKAANAIHRESWGEVEEILHPLFDSATHMDAALELLISGKIAPQDHLAFQALFHAFIAKNGLALREGTIGAAEGNHFQVWTHFLLGVLPGIPSQIGLDSLKTLIGASALDALNLDALLALQENEIFEILAARGVIGIAAKAQPPRTDLLLHFLEDSHAEICLEALKALFPIDPELAASFAKSRFLSADENASSRETLLALLGTYGKPDEAFEFLSELARKEAPKGLPAAFYALHGRNQEQAVEDRFLTESSSSARKFLLLSGAENLPLLELALDTDLSGEVRGQALILMTGSRPDEGTAQRVINAFSEVSRRAPPGYEKDATLVEVWDLLFALKNLANPSVTRRLAPETLRSLESQIRIFVEDKRLDKDQVHYLSEMIPAFQS